MTGDVSPPSDASEQTEREAEVRAAMNTGALYTDYGPGLETLDEARTRGKERVRAFNASEPRDVEGRNRLLREVLGSVGEDCWVEPPLHVMYGKTVHFGAQVYANVGLTLVDDVRITVGDRVMFAPHVTIATTGHPIHPRLRQDFSQFSAPVTIGDDVWVGSGAQIMPGVSIGRGSVIAAGAIVTAHVPEMVVVAGTPARVIREITDADLQWSFREPGRARPLA